MRTACGFTPQKADEGVALLTQCTASLPAATGVLTRYHPHIAGYGFSIPEPANVSQENFCAQGGDRPYSGMRHQKACLRPFASQLAHHLVQLLDLLLQPHVK